MKLHDQRYPVEESKSSVDIAFDIGSLHFAQVTWDGPRESGDSSISSVR